MLFLSFVEWKVKYRFVTTLRKLLASNRDISPAHDKYICSLNSIAYVLTRWIEVILEPAGEYLLYKNWDSDHLVSQLISNGDFIYTILIHFSLNFKAVLIKPEY